MGGVGVHLPGGDDHLAPGGTGGHPAPAEGGAPVRDTGEAALLSSEGDLPLQGGETTGDKKTLPSIILSINEHIWGQPVQEICISSS